MAQLAAFDTHKYIKELTASGFDERQAEVIIKSILEGRDYDVSKLATKEQLENTRKELKGDISSLDNKIEATKKELSKDIEVATSRLEATIIKWMVGLLSPIYIGSLVVLIR